MAPPQTSSLIVGSTSSPVFWRSLLPAARHQGQSLNGLSPRNRWANRTSQPDPGAYLRIYINYQQDDWVDLLPWPSSHTTILRIQLPWSPPSSPTRAFTPNSKCPLLLWCRILLTLLLSDLKELHQYFATKSLVRQTVRGPLSFPSTPDPAFQVGTLCGWTLGTSKQRGLRRSWTSLPRTVSDRRESVLPCLRLGPVPGSVSHPPGVPLSLCSPLALVTSLIG